MADNAIGTSPEKRPIWVRQLLEIAPATVTGYYPYSNSGYVSVGAMVVLPMNDAGLYRLMADAILIVHFAIVMFVVVGFMLILTGLLARWTWIHHRTFRIVHLVAVVFIAMQAWFGQLCPLTLWENALRRRAGQSGYTETFVEHWLQKVLFYQAEPWVFTTLYTCFAVVVMLAWFIGRRVRKK